MMAKVTQEPTGRKGTICCPIFLGPTVVEVHMGISDVLRSSIDHKLSENYPRIAPLRLHTCRPSDFMSEAVWRIRSSLMLH